MTRDAPRSPAAPALVGPGARRKGHSQSRAWSRRMIPTFSIAGAPARAARGTGHLRPWLIWPVMSVAVSQPFFYGCGHLEGQMISNRRSIIGFLVIVFVVSTLAAFDMEGARPQEDRRVARQRLTGSWDAEVAQDGFPPTRRLFTFTSDGAAVGTAVLQATPVGVQLFGAPHGAWIRTGDRQF